MREADLESPCGFRCSVGAKADVRLSMRSSASFRQPESRLREERKSFSCGVFSESYGEEWDLEWDGMGLWLLVFARIIGCFT